MKKSKSKKTEKITRVILTDHKRVMKIMPDGRLRELHGKTNWKALAAMRHEDIDYSDSPPFTDAEWAKKKLVMPKPKNRVTIRLDQDVLEWLKQRGTGYQTRINAILRQYMGTHAGRV